MSGHRVEVMHLVVPLCDSCIVPCTLIMVSIFECPECHAKFHVDLPLITVWKEHS